MNLAFADTMEADRQDRACGLLVSLSLLADTAKRRAACNGNSHVRLLYQRELHYHYERVVFDALRLLGVSIGNTEIASETNVDRICNRGIRLLWRFWKSMKITLIRKSNRCIVDEKEK